VNHETVPIYDEVKFTSTLEIQQMGFAHVMYGCTACGTAVPWLSAHNGDLYLRTHARWHKDHP
jgi:hypothetical protein